MLAVPSRCKHQPYQNLKTWLVSTRVLEEAVACRLCRRARRDTVALPCSHFLFCGACLAHAAACPACTVPLTHRQPLRID